MNKKYINDLDFSNIKIINTGKKYYLNDKPFGVLNSNEDEPLYSVCVSNSSLSIDIWSGCSFGCKYCHVQGIYSHIKECGKMRKKPMLNTKFTIEEIVEALMAHPFFEKDKTVISIGTGSTEPFGNNEVTDSTMKILEVFVEKNLKNPFWIVTKAGIPKRIVNKVREITQHGNKIMFSMCWANNPKEIEPCQNNRFKNIELLSDIDNVYVAWYMRPLVKEWGANQKNLTSMFKYVSENYGKYIDLIVPGGMRWTSGIEYALAELNHVKVPNLIKDDNKKTLDDKIVNDIINLSNIYFPNIPVFFNSSCALSYMLSVGNISLVNCFKESFCLYSLCPLFQRKSCKINLTNIDIKKVEKKLNDMGIVIKLLDIDTKNKKIVSIPEFSSFNYTIKQIIIRTLACHKNGGEKYELDRSNC